MSQEKLNPIKIGSAISDPDERRQVEHLIANYRKQLLADITHDVWKLREFKYKDDIPAYKAMNSVLLELKKYD